MRLVKLTRFYHNQWGQWNIHGKPVWVNPEQITHLLPLSTSIITSEEDSKKPVKERQTAQYTAICFPAGSSEGVEVENVCETPEQIFTAITRAEIL